MPTLILRARRAAACLLAWALVPSVPARAQGPAQADTALASDERIVLLSTAGIAQAQFIDALRMRVPELDVRTVWQLDALELELTKKLGAQALFLNVRPLDDNGSNARKGDARVRVDLVLNDGRGFRRELSATPQELRAIASFSANLLFSLEEETEDTTNLELPPSEASAAVARLEDQLEDQLEKVVEKVVEPPTEPAVDPAPLATPNDAEGTGQELGQELAEPKASPTQVFSPWRLGLRLVPLVQVGLAPNFADPLVGGGAALGLDALREDGLLLGAEARVLLDVWSGDHLLLRTRAALDAGYAYRKGSLYLPIALGATLEAWTLRIAGTAVPAREAGAPASLIGARLRLDPSYRFLAPGLGQDGRAYLGARIEIAGSFATAAGARSVGLLANDGSPAFRLGGLELGLGVVFGMQFGRRRIQ